MLSLFFSLVSVELCAQTAGGASGSTGAGEISGASDAEEGGAESTEESGLSEDEAIALVSEALNEYKEGSFESAAAKLERAYESLPDVAILYNLARVYDAQNKCQKARAVFEQVRDTTEDIQLIRKASAALDKLDCEKAKAVLPKDGEEKDPVTPPPPVQSDSGLGALFWTGVVLGGVGVGSLVGAVVVDVITVSDFDEYKDVAEAGTDRARYDDLKSSIDDQKLIATILYGAGGALAATGVIMMIVDATSTGEGGCRGECLATAPSG